MYIIYCILYIMFLALCLLNTLLVLTLTMRELRMLIQSHCGDEEDGRIGLFS